MYLKSNRLESYVLIVYNKNVHSMFNANIVQTGMDKI